MGSTGSDGRKKRLRSVGLWGTTLFLTPSMAFVAGTSALAGDRKGKVWWGASRTWASGIMRSAGMTDLIVKGVERIYDGQPFILMANHQSHLDPPSIILSSDRPIGFLTKQELKLGAPVTATSPVAANKVYRASFGAATLLADANSISGRELVFSELTLDGTFSGLGKGFCGQLSAKLTQPVALELKGDQNTCLFFPTSEGAPLPEPAPADFVCALP